MLIAGDQNGAVCCYNLNTLLDFMKSTFDGQKFEGKNELEIKNYFKKSVKINLKYKVQIHKEAIKFITIPDELYPKVIITTSNDKTVKLIDFETGAYIDSLKQISVKYSSVPIGIKYLKDNPFLLKDMEENYDFNDNYNDNDSQNLISDNNNNNNEKKSEFIMIYRKDMAGPIQIPKINFNEAGHKEIFSYYDKIAEYNAKVLLLNYSKGLTFSSSRSNPWNYNVNVKLLLQKNEEEVKHLIDIVNKKEAETEMAEQQHQQISIFNNSYNPVFIDNLDRDEKYELKLQINAKIRNINIAVSKSIMLQKEMEVIEKFIRRQKNRGIDEDEEEIKKTSIKKKALPIIKKLKIKNKNKSNNHSLIDERSKKTQSTNSKILESKTKDKSRLNNINPLSTTKFKILNSSAKNKFSKNNSMTRASSYGSLFQKNEKKIPFSDKRFQLCNHMFNERFEELKEPFRRLLRKKKAYFLPKIRNLNSSNDK